MSTGTAPLVNVSRSVMEGKNASYHGSSSGFFPTQCSPMPQPALGLQRIIHGNGTSVGTVIALRCPDKYKLMGDSVKCVMDANSTYWVGKTYCKPLSYNETYGFQLAMLVSIVSSAIIFLMSMAFLTCCLVNCIEKSRRKEMDRDSEVPPQWEERRQDHQQEVNRARYSNKSRNNNNNNNFMEKEMTPWNQRDPGPCDFTCRCQQPYYDPVGPSCSSVAAARLPVLPGYEYSQPLKPQNHTPSYSYSQPQHVGSSRQTSNLDQVARRSDAVWEYRAKQNSLSGAPNQSRNKKSAKDFSIRVISV